MLKILFSVVAIVSLFGCASQQTPAPGTGQVAAGSVEQQVSARAEARWAAMIAQDFDKAHEFLSPGSKAAYPPDQFKARIHPLDWRSAKAVSAVCSEETCTVKLEIAFYHERLKREIATMLDETWIKDAGNWGLVFNG